MKRSVKGICVLHKPYVLARHSVKEMAGLQSML